MLQSILYFLQAICHICSYKEALLSLLSGLAQLFFFHTPPPTLSLNANSLCGNGRKRWEKALWGKQTVASVFALITALLPDNSCCECKQAEFNSAFFPPQCNSDPAMATQEEW